MTVDVVRIDLVRKQFGQFLASIGLAAGVVARRWGNPAFMLLVGTFYLYVLVVLWRARRRRLGWRELHFADGHVQLGDTEISRNAFLYWTIDEREVHLWGLSTSWRLGVAEADRGALERSLSRSFGPPLPLAYRGSLLARGLARNLTFVCVGSIGLGFGCKVPMLVVGGLLGGLATSSYWSALSQKVAVIEAPHRRRHK